MIPLLEQKNGQIQLSESLQEQMNNCIADLMQTNGSDFAHISKDLKVQLRADSSGNWELRLLAALDSRPFRTVPSLAWTPQEHSLGPSTSSCSEAVSAITSRTGT
jgi:hypothetical protein